MSLNQRVLYTQCVIESLYVTSFSFLLWFSYSSPNFSPLLTLAPPSLSLLQSVLTLWSITMGPLYMFLDYTLSLLSPIIPFSPPIWSLSVCSLFPCLSFYVVHLFVLLIRLHLQVRSHGVCLSPPGLLHSASCPPAPSMPSRRVGADMNSLECNSANSL